MNLTFLLRIKHLSRAMLIVCFCQISLGQENIEQYITQQFPFTDVNWTIENADSSAVELNTTVYKNKSALKLEPNQKAILKNNKYKNFILEFNCSGLSGPGFGFRVQNRKNYEYLYLRLGLSGKKDALQYVPIDNGNLPWQLYNYPKYEGETTFPRENIGTLPLSMKKELKVGLASGALIKELEEKGVSFSHESGIYLTNDTAGYIFDPQKSEASLFEIQDSGIIFLNPRAWIRIKVKVIEGMASFYIEDMENPAFVVKDLKRDVMGGGISLISDSVGVYFANVAITELQETEDRKAKEKLPEDYLTKWHISKMFTKDSINFISQIDSLNRNDTTFKPIKADNDGLINISKFYDDMTKTVALTYNLKSDSDKTVKLNFDYADHLVIFLDSKVLFDKGMNFQPPVGKGEEGRVFVDDERINLDLKKGSNHLIFMLSADNRQKFNWGFIAKLESLNGISIE